MYCQKLAEYLGPHQPASFAVEKYYFGYEVTLTLPNYKRFKGVGISIDDAKNIAAHYALKELNKTFPVGAYVLVDLDSLSLAEKNIVYKFDCFNAHCELFTSDKTMHNVLCQTHVCAKETLESCLLFRAGQLTLQMAEEHGAHFVLVCGRKHAFETADILANISGFKVKLFNFF